MVEAIQAFGKLEDVAEEECAGANGSCFSTFFFLINAFLLFLDEDSNDDDDDEETAADEANSSIPIVQNAFSLLNEDD